MKTIRLSRSGRELMILREISGNAESSYRHLGRVAGVSAAQVADYMRCFLDCGFVEKSGGTNRTMRYRLTAAGWSELADLELAHTEDLKVMREQFGG